MALDLVDPEEYERTFQVNMVVEKKTDGDCKNSFLTSSMINFVIYKKKLEINCLTC